jgi:hypothetical protein
MPKGEFRREVERELTGKDSELSGQTPAEATLPGAPHA